MPLVQTLIPQSCLPRAASVAIILVQCCVSGFAHADEWNQFRGLGGVAAESRAPVKLEEPSWKVPVAAGLSSPVLFGGRVFLTSVEDGRLVTHAFDAESGKSLWNMQAPEVPLEIVHAEASPASPTPLVDTARVIVYFGSYGLLCYDHDGAEVWKEPIPTPKSLYGMTTSPIAHGENVILVLDNDSDLPDSKLSQSKVISISKATGELVWETARPFCAERLVHTDNMGERKQRRTCHPWEWSADELRPEYGRGEMVHYRLFSRDDCAAGVWKGSAFRIGVDARWGRR